MQHPATSQCSIKILLGGIELHGGIVQPRSWRSCTGGQSLLAHALWRGKSRIFHLRGNAPVPLQIRAWYSPADKAIVYRLERLYSAQEVATIHQNHHFNFLKTMAH